MKNVFEVICLCFLWIGTLGAADPTQEQLELMREYGLSVPPTIIKTAPAAIKKAATSERIPDISNSENVGPVTREARSLMSAEGLSVPPVLLDKNGNKRYDVKLVNQEGKRIDVTFEPYGVSELPLKKGSSPLKKPITGTKKATLSIVDLIEDAPLLIKEKIVSPTVDVIKKAMESNRVDEKNFSSKVTSSKEDVIVVFGATWCAPCRRFHDTVELFRNDNTSSRIYECNIDECPNLASTYRAWSIPKTVLFKNGVECDNHIGAFDLDHLREFYQGVKLVTQSASTKDIKLEVSKVIDTKPAPTHTEYRQEISTPNYEAPAETFRHAGRSPRGGF